METITHEFIKDFFDYKDGHLIRKKQTSGNAKIGDVAGSLSKKVNRNQVHINGKKYMTSRIIFFWHYAYFPIVVDHINHDTSDDRIENLRAATKLENARNCSKTKNKTSIYLGVSKRKNIRGKKFWLAQIRVVDKTMFLGNFVTPEEAALAYNKSAVKYFGEFANLNIIKPTI